MQKLVVVGHFTTSTIVLHHKSGAFAYLFQVKTFIIQAQNDLGFVRAVACSSLVKPKSTIRRVTLG